MELRDIYYKLRELFGQDVLDFNDTVIDPVITINSMLNFDVLKYLKESEEFMFSSLMCLSGVDHNENIEIVYHIYSQKLNIKLTLKAKLEVSNLNIKSINMLWHGSDWFEREIFDLLGVVFVNHPNLKRILLPEDWVGHPLRKNYVFPKEYGGMNNERKYECS
jgi:NADH-quinone oxidoreductase subunit C